MIDSTTPADRPSFNGLMQEIARDRHREMMAAFPQIPIQHQVAVCDRWRSEAAAEQAYRRGGIARFSDFSDAVLRRMADAFGPVQTARRGRPWEDTA